MLNRRGTMQRPKLCWSLRIWTRRVSSRLKSNCGLLRVTLASLLYNSFLDLYYVGDTAMEPVFWFVDHFTRFFGPIFVASACLLTGSIVVVAYVLGVPYWWQHSPIGLAALFLIGNWVLLNICFHFYMAATTHPGCPPEDKLIVEAVSICKKCIAPKPPRTHHCSICNRCILKMDHHCPWLNNCVGHFNHRYFFMFCAYMVVGALFLVIFGFNIFWDHITKYRSEGYSNDTVANMSYNCTGSSCNLEFGHLVIVFGKMDILRHDPALPYQYESWYHGLVVYAALMCLGVVVAMGSLTGWHSRLIARGETSIEAHINKAETIRLAKEGKTYLNPYNFGRSNNWKLFLGLYHGRTWRHLLLPSRHPPLGSGLQWQTIQFPNHSSFDEC